MTQSNVDKGKQFDWVSPQFDKYGNIYNVETYQLLSWAKKVLQRKGWHFISKVYELSYKVIFVNFQNNYNDYIIKYIITVLLLYN